VVGDNAIVVGKSWEFGDSLTFGKFGTFQKLSPFYDIVAILSLSLFKSPSAASLARLIPESFQHLSV
jgi:hypothetical protein